MLCKFGQYLKCLLYKLMRLLIKSIVILCKVAIIVTTDLFAWFLNTDIHIGLIS